MPSERRRRSSAVALSMENDMMNKSANPAHWVTMCFNLELIAGMEQTRRVGDKKRSRYLLANVLKFNTLILGKTHFFSGRTDRR
jgi:hypothetical protein